MRFYFRETELKSMNSLYEQVASCARMIVLTGRRRIGKTLLSLTYVKDKPHLYLFVAKKSESLLCGEFVKQIREVFPATAIHGEITEFKGIFKLLLDIAKEQPYVLIIDEFQEFMSINESVYSDVQQLWDLAKFEAKIQVLFLGSVYSMMHKIFEEADKPLFGRADLILKLKPFSISDIHRILIDYKRGDLETLFNFYTITGGVPKYMDQLLTHKAFTITEMTDQILAPGSRFLEEGKMVLIEEFGKEYAIYFSILELIAVGKTGRGEIESILQKDIGGYLHRLESVFNIIKAKKPFNAKPGSKLQKYYIADLYLRFWFRFIFRNRTAVEMENFQFIKQSIEQNIQTYKGHILEQFFFDLFSQSKKFNNIGSYWNRSGTDEIDLVAVNDLEKIIIVGEIKLKKDKISIDVLKHKAQQLIKDYHDYEVQYVALSLEDAADYLA